MPTNRLSVFDHFVKLALQACNFIKKETLALVFACEFCAISKNTYSTEYFRTTTSSLVPCVRYFPVNFAYLLRTLFWQNTSRRLLLTYALVLAKNTSIYLTRSWILGQLARFICGLKGIKMSVMPIRSNRLSDADFWEDTPTEMFFYGFCEFLRRAFFIEHLRWLFLMLSNLYDHKFLCEFTTAYILKCSVIHSVIQVTEIIYDETVTGFILPSQICVSPLIFSRKYQLTLKCGICWEKLFLKRFFLTKIGKKTPRVLRDPPTLSNLLDFAESLLPLLIKTKE